VKREGPRYLLRRYQISPIHHLVVVQIRIIEGEIFLIIWCGDLRIVMFHFYNYI
jgi:hypothetical protein